MNRNPIRGVGGFRLFQSGVYSGRWIDRDWKKNDNPHSVAERIWDSALATVIRDRCRGKSGTVTEEKKPVTTIAPLLYDLTSLQREAANPLRLFRQKDAPACAGML